MYKRYYIKNTYTIHYLYIMYTYSIQIYIEVYSVLYSVLY